jgi:hypothetical protein
MKPPYNTVYYITCFDKYIPFFPIHTFLIGVFYQYCVYSSLRILYNKFKVGGEYGE